MARFCRLVTSFTHIVLLSFILSFCVSAAFIPKPIRPDPVPVDNPTVSPGRGGIGEDPYNPAVEPEGGGIGVPRIGTGQPETLEPSPPFQSSEESAEDEQELAEKIKDMLDQVASDLAAASSASPVLATPAANLLAMTTPTASSTVGVNAASACYIYGAYNSMCSVGTYSIAFMDSPAYDTVKASCLCYSSTYYVPAVYDIAASACTAYATGPSDSASSAQNFCSRIGNVRNATPAEFDQFDAVTTAATTTTTSKPSSSTTQTRSAQILASPTTGSVSTADRLLKVEKRMWWCITALIVAAGLA